MMIVNNRTSYTTREIDAALKADGGQPYIDSIINAPENWDEWEKVRWVQWISMPDGTRVCLTWHTTARRWKYVKATADEGDACGWNRIYSADYNG